MLLVAIFLVVVPLWQSLVPQLLAFGGIVLGVPVFVVFVMERPIRIKPKLFDTISSKDFTLSLSSTQFQHDL